MRLQNVIQSLSMWSSVLILATLFAPAHTVAQGKGGKPAPTAEVPVALSFRDDAADKVKSDNLGAYANGESGVRAVILNTGILNVFPNNDGSARRRLNINLDDPWLGGAVTCGPSTEPCLWNPAAHGTVMSVDEISLTVVEICGEEAAQTLGFHDANWAIGETRCARMAYWFFDPSGGAFRWTARFRPSSWPLSNEVLATRTSANSWAITVEQPAAGASSCPDLGDCTVIVRPRQSKGKTSLLIEGYFRAPFLFTVTRQ